MVDASTEDVIREQLEPGERALWVGQPRQGAVLHWYDACS
jgi:hypothetical protein